jgi:hypothetical protein
LIKAGKDGIDATDAVRLPNAIQKSAGMKLTIDPNAPTQQM